MVPIGSMYGIFTYIYHKNQPNVVKYTIHGSYGVELFESFRKKKVPPRKVVKKVEQGKANWQENWTKPTVDFKPMARMGG